jgi:hypothetical protein
VVVVILVGVVEETRVVVNEGLDVMLMVGVVVILGDGKCVTFVGTNVNDEGIVVNMLLGVVVIALVEIVGLIVVVGVGREEVTLVEVIVDLEVGVVVVKNVGL